jgi:hypothetical protein
MIRTRRRSRLGGYRHPVCCDCAGADRFPPHGRAVECSLGTDRPGRAFRLCRCVPFSFAFLSGQGLKSTTLESRERKPPDGTQGFLRLSGFFSRERGRNGTLSAKSLSAPLAAPPFALLASFLGCRGGQLKVEARSLWPPIDSCARPLPFGSVESGGRACHPSSRRAKPG